MTLALHEIECFFESDAKPLPRREGPPLDEVLYPYVPVRGPNKTQARILEIVGARRWYTTAQVARAVGIEPNWCASQLNTLVAMGLVHRRGGVGRGYGGGRTPHEWRRARGGDV